MNKFNEDNLEKSLIKLNEESYNQALEIQQFS
jgi:hypothetical protein